MSYGRQAIFDAISQERDYQDSKWTADVTRTAGKHSIHEYMSFISDYAAEANWAFCRLPAPHCDHIAIHTMRKIAALAVACMEQHGVLTREFEGARAVGADVRRRG